MKQIAKRLTALVLCIVMICTLLPQLALQSSADYNGGGWSYNEQRKLMTFSGNGAMQDYIPGQTYPDFYMSINGITFPSVFTTARFLSGITHIGNNMLKATNPNWSGLYCSKVSTIYIGSTVTSIGDNAFSLSTIKNVYIFSKDASFKANVFPSTATIHGYLGSKTQTYAESYGLTFVPFDELNGTCGANLKWSLNPNEGTLIITGTGDMYDYEDDLSVPWCFFADTITDVSFPEGITSIGARAFYRCTNLSSTDIPNGISRIGHSAFYECANMASASFPDSVSCIEEGAFAYCSSLNEVTIPASAETIGSSAFANSGLEKVTVLSSDCSISDKNQTLGTYNGGTTIYSYAYSTAKEYAEDHNYPFIVIECEPSRHIYSNVQTIEATCTEDGYTKHTCEYCGKYYLTDEVDALGHDLGEWTTKTAATCLENGEKERFCSRCNYFENEVIVASGHAFGEWENDPPATCIEDGKQVRTCANCGASEEITITAPGHSYGDWITDSEVSCTADGYRYRVCSVCANIDEETTSAYGHSFSEWQIEKEASCTETGLKSRTCATCNEREEEVIPVLGHDYSVVVTDATCTESGYSTHTCSRCGDSFVDGVVEALGHNYEATVVEATCTEGGYTEHICSVCKDTYIDAETPATGHNYVATIVEATCTEGGYTEHICSGCNDTYRDEEVSALGHDYEVITTEPTCTTEGFTTHTCRRCSDSIVDGNKAALGHDWDNGVVTVPASQFSAGVKVFTCSRCGTTKEESIPQLHSCDGGDGCPTADYLDVPGNTNWAHEGIDFCVHEGLMGSTKTNALTFEPNTPTSRAMIVSILYRMEGSPAVSYKATFTDVPAGKWFTEGVIWASENGVVSGYGNGKFGPNDNITREQLASIMMRYTNFKGYKANTMTELSIFSDATKISNWASLSVKWAVGAGIVSGKASGGKTLMDPQGKATRAEVASILMRYIGLIDSLQPLNDPSFCNHKWIVNTSKAATCEGEGNTVYYCTECASAKTETNSPLGHDDVKIDSLEPTCEQAGWNQWRCSRCGRTYKDSKPALGHDDKKTATQAPTCTEAGWNQWTCARCNRSYKDPVAALGHDDVKTVVAPTCTSGGYEQFTCKRCGRSYKQNQTPALGHSFSNGFCIRCGAADPNNPTPSELTAEQVYAKCSPAVFSIYTYDKNSYPIAQGSGFFVSSTGYAVTNSHVVEDAYFVRAVLSDGREIFAEELVVGNYYEDWALLKFPGSGYPFLTMGSSSTIVGGATVYAIGSPEGLSNSISSGIISNPNRYLASDYDVIQITTPISPGSSGGALLNKYGQVIGITSGNLDVSGNDLYYAVPIKCFRDELIANGISVPRRVEVIAEIA